MQMHYESINSVITRAGNPNTGQLSVGLMLLPNRKGRDNNLLTASYINNYNSQKYVGHPQLSELTINYDAYLKFEYLEFADTNRISGQVLASYPHLEDLYTWLVESYNTMVEEYGTFFPEGWTPEHVEGYRDYILESPGLAGGKGGKHLYISPGVAYSQDSRTQEQIPLAGIDFMVDDYAFVVSLTFDQFENMTNQLADVTNPSVFRSESSNLYIQAQNDHIIELLSSGGTTGGAVAPARGTTVAPGRTPRRPRRGSVDDEANEGIKSTRATRPTRKKSSGGLGSIDRGTTVTRKRPSPTPKVDPDPFEPVEEEEIDLSEVSADLNGEEVDPVEEVNLVSEDDMALEILAGAEDEEFDLDEDDFDLDEDDLDL